MAQGRRVRRVVRKFDTWTVAKIAFSFHLCMVVVFMTAGVVLWVAADGQGLVAKLEKTIRTNLQLDSFHINAGVLFQSLLLAGVLLAVLATGFYVVAAFLYNLLSDVVGGVQVWVLEEIYEPPAPPEVAPLVDPATLPEAPAGVYDHAAEPPSGPVALAGEPVTSAV